MPYPKLANLSRGSAILSLNPLHQANAPAIGGMLLYSGALSDYLSTNSYPSKNIYWTDFKSYLYISNRTICFFSNSS